MAKCHFCGSAVPASRGKMFVKTDGRIFYFDSSKCERNFRLKREGVKVRWTALHAKKKAAVTKKKS